MSMIQGIYNFPNQFTILAVVWSLDEPHIGYHNALGFRKFHKVLLELAIYLTLHVAMINMENVCNIINYSFSLKLYTCKL